jgi:predicted Zn-dependent protease
MSALNRRPDDWPIRFNLALFCQELKRDAQAAEQFDYLVRRFPREKHFRLCLANSLLAAGNKSGALSQLEAALRLDPDDEDLQRQVPQLSQSGGVP